MVHPVPLHPCCIHCLPPATGDHARGRGGISSYPLPLGKGASRFSLRRHHGVMQSPSPREARRRIRGSWGALHFRKCYHQSRKATRSKFRAYKISLSPHPGLGKICQSPPSQILDVGTSKCSLGSGLGAFCGMPCQENGELPGMVVPGSFVRVISVQRQLSRGIEKERNPRMIQFS